MKFHTSGAAGLAGQSNQGQKLHSGVIPDLRNLSRHGVSRGDPGYKTEFRIGVRNDSTGEAKSAVTKPVKK